jgi:hypothetical protein
MSRKCFRSRAVAWAGVAAVGAASLLSVGRWAVAQFAANTRVNNGLYGAGTVGSVQYARGPVHQTSQLRSEVRHAYWKSGALPSDVKMNYAAMGPLASGGAISYIPSSKEYASSKTVVQDPLKQPPSMQRRAVPPAPAPSSVTTTYGGGGTPGLGTVTYSAPRSRASQSLSATLAAPTPIAGARPLPAGEIPTGEIPARLGPSSEGPEFSTSVFQRGDPQLESVLAGFSARPDSPNGTIRYSGPPAQGSAATQPGAR